MKEKYEELKKKYDLPEFTSLDLDFEIYSIDEDENIIREILKKMYDKFDAYTKFLEDIIQPDSRISLMREASALTPQDRKNMVKMHMRGMYITREFLELNLDYSEEEAVKMINKNHSEWQKMKLDIKKIIVKLKESWSKDLKLEEDRGYFG